VKKINFGEVQDATDRLARYRADEFFPALLSTEQQEAIQRRRIKKAKKTKEKVKEVRDDEYIVKGGGIDVDGSIIDDFDIARFMQDAEDEETGTLFDLRVDTRDLPRAKNFYDFCLNMFGPNTKLPYPLQMWVGVFLFGEVCPCCSDPKWMHIENVPKDFPVKDFPEHLTFLERGKCPKCGRNKLDLIQNHGLRRYVQLVNVLGQRSGKSLSAAMYSAYLKHRLETFPPLSSLTQSMQASTELTFTFVSLTFAKAKGVLWTPFKEIISDSPWFQDYYGILDFYGEKHGKELYKDAAEFIRIHYRNLRFYPSGPKGSTLRGDTRIGAALDELGLFRLPRGDDEEDGTSEMANADEAHKSLMNSLATADGAFTEAMRNGYYAAPSPIMLNVSSPMSIRDKMMRLLKDSRKPENEGSMLGINLPTWKFNPYMDRDNAIIANAYATNWEKAERDYGANPPLVHSRYVPLSSITNGSFSNGLNSHNYIYQYDQPGEVYGKIERVRTFNWPSVISLDAGSSNNSFCVVGAHYNFDTGKTVVSTIIECMPTEGRKVNFNLLYENVILPLARELNAVGVVADQWQSIDLLHRVKRDMGNNPLGKPRTLSQQYSPKRRDFDNVLAMMASKNILFPSVNAGDQQEILDGQIVNYRNDMIGKPVQHLMLQMVTVRDVGETRAPEKGENYTDDSFRAVVLGLTAVHMPKVMERLQQARGFSYSNGGRQRMPEPFSMGRSGQNFGRFGVRR
jgi:hypothetical protein